MNVPKYAIDDFLNEHIQAIYGIIIMPATVVGLFGQFIIHPYLNIIAGLHKEGKLEEVKKILVKIILCYFDIRFNMRSRCLYLRNSST